MTLRIGNTPFSAEEERIAHGIVGSAFAVHKNLGPGLLESVYEVCFCHELRKRGLAHARQVVIPIIYDDLVLDESLSLDVLVENFAICELKAVESANAVHMAQLMTQLKLARKRLGFLINFNVPGIRQGIKRIGSNTNSLRVFVPSWLTQ